VAKAKTQRLKSPRSVPNQTLQQTAGRDAGFPEFTVSQRGRRLLSFVVIRPWQSVDIDNDARDWIIAQLSNGLAFA
jgi:hypothetical protein